MTMLRPGDVIHHSDQVTVDHLKPGPAFYEQALDVALAQVRATVIRRHRRYGLNLMRHAEFGIIVRIDDKTERLKNMVAANEDDEEEPRVETWGDIAGYALQAILMEREQFTLPMAPA